MVSTHKNQRLRMFLSAALLLLIMAQTFSFAIKDKMHQRIPEALDPYAEAISIVISHASFGVGGYAGYRNIYDTLVANGFDWDHHEEPVVLNQAIEKAREIKEAGSEPILFSVGDVGFIDYTRAAFALSGYKIESFLYLYFVVLFIQVVAFFWQFRKDDLAVTGLVLFLLGHYIVLTGLYDAGYNLWTVHNYRFLSVLGLLPLSHIFLLAFLKKPLRPSTFLGAVAQILIFVFILRCRNSALWMLGPLLFMIGVAALGWLAKKKLFDIKLWPAFMALGVVFLSIFLKPFIMDPGYFGEKNLASHTFWFPVYVGLAIDPTIREIYGPRPNVDKDLDWYFRVACQEIHNEDGRLKARVRTWVCSHAEVTKPILRVLNSWRGWRLDYTQNDQDGARAVLKWLGDNGKTEAHIYTFGPEDKVGYPRWFGQCDSEEKYLQHELFNKDLRPFDSKKDFKWREMDRIMGLVVKDAFTNHPFRVLKTVLITKPFFFFLFWIMYFMKVKSLGTLILIIMVYTYLLFHIKGSAPVEMRKLLLLLFAMFAFSMVVTLVAYPAPHTISDQVVLLTTCILGLIWYSLSKKRIKAR